MTDHYKFVTRWSPTGLSRLGIGAQPSPGHNGRAMLRMTPQNMARSELNPVVRPRLGLGFQVGAIVTGRAVAPCGDRRDGRIERLGAAALLMRTSRGFQAVSQDVHQREQLADEIGARGEDGWQTVNPC